jgi:hypothetical protein
MFTLCAAKVAGNSGFCQCRLAQTALGVFFSFAIYHID